jgi:hypothetical protein
VDEREDDDVYAFSFLRALLDELLRTNDLAFCISTAGKDVLPFSSNSTVATGALLGEGFAAAPSLELKGMEGACVSPGKAGTVASR